MTDLNALIERLEQGVFKVSDEPGGHPIYNNVAASQAMREAAAFLRTVAERQPVEDGEVIDADRLAAGPYADSLSDMQDIFDGKADGLSVVKEFARHRQAAEQANAAEIAELTALLREVRACRVYRSGETVHGTQYGGEAVPRAATGTDGEAVMTHTEVTLKPCPFCGTAWSDDADATMVQPYFQGDDGTWMIFCEGCSAETADYYTKAEAITAWNQRALDTDLEKRVAVLEEALIKISRAVHSNRLVSHKLTKIDETCRAALNDTHSEEHTR